MGTAVRRDRGLGGRGLGVSLLGTLEGDESGLKLGERRTARLTYDAVLRFEPRELLGHAPGV